MSDLTTLLLSNLLAGDGKKARNTDSDLVSIIKMYYKIEKEKKKEEEEKKKKDKEIKMPQVQFTTLLWLGPVVGFGYLFVINWILEAVKHWHGFH